MIKLVVFDIYKTILKVGPRLKVRPLQWHSLWEDFFPANKPPYSHSEFRERMEREVLREHQKAESLGVLFPEVRWDDLVARVLPGLRALGSESRGEFIFHQMALERDIGLMPGSADALAMLRSRGVLLGVASNAQRYTFKELAIHLGEAGLSLEVFRRDFCCWSFLNGFSKPNPHVFRILSARAADHGIRPEEILMVGDRIDNDIRPASTFGWRVFHLNVQSDPSPFQGGDWNRFKLFMETRI